jgi:histone arginine demethylase JMJD6
MKKQIDYLEYDSSFSANFLQNYHHQKPCIIKNCVNKWKARHWDFDQLNLIRAKNEDSGNLKIVNIRDPKTGFWHECCPKQLPKICEKLKAATLQYVPNEWLFPLTHPELLEEIQIPQELNNDQSLDKIPSTIRPIYPRILIGYTATGSSLHVDFCNTSSWMALIQGRKRWLAFPPSEGKHVAEFFGEFTPETEKIISKLTTYYDFYLEEGELLYLPGKWPHQVFNETTTIAITYNIFNISQALEYSLLMHKQYQD